jgi:DNA-directed RNA polymerase III subunit RPC3
VLIRKERPAKKKAKIRSAEEEYDLSLESSCHLRLSYNRFGVIMRNELIVGATKDRWNVPTSEVMRALLAGELNEASDLGESRTHKPMSISGIIDNIPREISPVLLSGIIQKGGSSWSKNLMDVTRAYTAVMACMDSARGMQGDAFLQEDGSGDKAWYVTVEGICTRLRMGVMNQLVREKLGNHAARVLTCFSTGNKILETTVSGTLRSCSGSGSCDYRFAISQCCRSKTSVPAWHPFNDSA